MAGAGDHTVINLLDDVDAAIRRYCVMPDEHFYTACTCWTAYTHMSDLFELRAAPVGAVAGAAIGQVAVNGGAAGTSP